MLEVGMHVGGRILELSCMCQNFARGQTLWQKNIKWLVLDQWEVFNLTPSF
jgi:hypothetical protein